MKTFLLLFLSCASLFSANVTFEFDDAALQGGTYGFKVQPVDFVWANGTAIITGDPISRNYRPHIPVTITNLVGSANTNVGNYRVTVNGIGQSVFYIHVWTTNANAIDLIVAAPGQSSVWVAGMFIPSNRGFGYSNTFIAPRIQNGIGNTNSPSNSNQVWTLTNYVTGQGEWRAQSGGGGGSATNANPPIGLYLNATLIATNPVILVWTNAPGGITVSIVSNSFGVVASIAMNGITNSWLKTNGGTGMGNTFITPSLSGGSWAGDIDLQAAAKITVNNTTFLTLVDRNGETANFNFVDSFFGTTNTLMRIGEGMKFSNDVAIVAADYTDSQISPLVSADTALAAYIAAVSNFTRSVSNIVFTATNNIETKQFGSLNLTNWSLIPTGSMANVVSTTFLTNFLTSVSNLAYTLAQNNSNLSYAIGTAATNYANSVTNSAMVTNWINFRQFASAVLSNLSTMAGFTWTNVPFGGTNILLRTSGGTNFFDLIGQLNNWALYPTNTMNSNALNAVLSFGSNQVRVLAGANITVTPAANGNVMEFTVAGNSAGSGGTNFEAIVTSGTNIDATLGTRQTLQLITLSNQFVNFQGTPLLGNTIKLWITNGAATNVSMFLNSNGTAVTFYDTSTKTNQASFQVTAGANEKFVFVWTTNNGARWRLDAYQRNEPSLAVASAGANGFLGFLTNADGTVITITNNYIPQGSSMVSSNLAGNVSQAYTNAAIINMAGLADNTHTNVPKGGTNISVRTTGGTNFFDTIGELNNWAQLGTNNIANLTGATNGLNAGKQNTITNTVLNVLGAGGGSTNYVFTCFANSINSFIIGSSNVLIASISGGVAGAIIPFTIDCTNLSASTWGFSFSAGTNRWLFAGPYGTNGPTVMTNNTRFRLAGELNGSNVVAGWTTFNPAQ